MVSNTRSPEKQVRDLMSPLVKTLLRNDEVLSADTLMRDERIRHVPVLDEDGRLAGILSQRDLFFSGLVRALGHGTSARDRALGAMVVKAVMTTEVITTTPETSIRAAARIMVDRKIGCLPVLDGESLVGLLSESDIVSAVAHGEL